MGNKKGAFVLGIDMGTSSLGWTLLQYENDKCTGLIDGGVRIYDAGLDNLEMDGKGKSRNVKRREARLIRRQLERRSRRLEKIARTLQTMSLLPEGDVEGGEARHDYFKSLDGKLIESLRDNNELNIYKLRARALDDKLEPYELGRALYHLSQRRGFASNRREGIEDDDKERGKVKKGIGELQSLIQESGARTLGEYFSKLDPHENRIRERYTSRKMYTDEFDRIWESQKIFHPDCMTDDNYKLLHKAIFYQRPLKIQKHLIGMCEFEEGKRRAPWALLSAQRFRYLQKLNDLRYIDTDGIDVDLDADQLEAVAGELEKKEKMTFGAIRKILGLKSTCKFNFELAKEKDIPGNRTAARLIKIFGPRWEEFSAEEQAKVVEDIRSILKDETLKRRGMNHWGLDEEQAEKFSKVTLEQGHCNLSKVAINKLLSEMQKGVQLQTAIRNLYSDRWDRSVEPYDELPPINAGILSSIRNPVVERSLTELRRVVNAVIKKHGRPDTVNIELARDLKQSSKARGETHKRNKENQKRREEAAKKITDERGINDPSPADIEKVILADECRWECPYTGKNIEIEALVGPEPQFDIEHIIPFSRCLDNSYMNKTLCHADENRHVKRGKTPHEAYSADEAKWTDILERVSKFHGPARNIKLKRFMMHGDELNNLIEDFSNRQLNDTRYASKLAKQYLGLLYGGIKGDGIDSDGKRRVHVVGGTATAQVRRALGLNSILGDGGIKTRDDHRHHLVDAICIALTDPSTVAKISRASAKAEIEHGRPFREIPPPWKGFIDDVRTKVNSTVVSRRLDKKVSGALHKETFYSAPYEEGKGSKAKQFVHIRKPLSSLSNSDIQNIADKRIRNIVVSRMDELSIKPKDFEKPENLPYHTTRNGKKIPVKSVRVKTALNVASVGTGHRVRYVMPDSNHHIEIVEDTETGKWDAEVVSLFEAYGRKREKKPVIRRNHGDGKRFLFSLFKKDIIELDCKGDWCEENCYFGYDSKMREKLCAEGRRELFALKKINTSKQLVFAPVNDAKKRNSSEVKGLTGTPSSLLKRKCQKKLITPLGKIRNACD